MRWEGGCKGREAGSDGRFRFRGQCEVYGTDEGIVRCGGKNRVEGGRKQGVVYILEAA